MRKQVVVWEARLKQMSTTPHFSQWVCLDNGFKVIKYWNYVGPLKFIY